MRSEAVVEIETEERPHAPAASILVVDDEDQVSRLIARILERGGYSPATACDVTGAKRLLLEQTFDVVLTDMNMPESSGLDLIAHIRDSHPDVAIVMVTGRNEPDLARTALESGAYGYIVKPFDDNEILIDVQNALMRQRLEIENRNHRDMLEQRVKERTAELWDAVQNLERTQEDLRATREDTIERLAVAAGMRDDETVAHIQRMSRYSALLAEALGEEPERCETIRLASAMHDVGKIGLPDRILLKRRKLAPDEVELMQQHCTLGHTILAESSSELLRTAAAIALTHHERYDGAGYPQGLAAGDIPLEGRIAAVADVFDALTTDRPFKRALPLMDAVEVLREEAGASLDPDLVDAFLGAMDGVLGIKEAYPD